MKNFLRIAYHQFIAKVIGRGEPFKLMNWFTNTCTIYNHGFTPSLHEYVLSDAYTTYQLQYVNTSINFMHKSESDCAYLIKVLLSRHQTHNCKFTNVAIGLDHKHYSSPQMLKGDVVAMKMITSVRKHKYYGYPILLIIKQNKDGKVRYFNVLKIGCTNRQFNQWTRIGKRGLIERHQHKEDDVKYINANYNKIYMESAKFFADYHTSLNKPISK